MSKKVVALFRSRNQAEEAVNGLRREGFEREISVVAKDDKRNNRGNDDQGMQMSNDTVTDGTATGGVVGGLAGLAVGAGALAIPGLGPIIAAGPIAGALSGAAAGGIGGALVDLGIPQAETKRLEEGIRQGKTLVSVECADDQADRCREILQNSGADEVKIHG